MPLIETVLNVSPPPKGDNWLKTFFDVLNRLWQQLATLINGAISFGDGIDSSNIDGVWVPALTVAGNFTVTHNLNRAPIGYLWVKSDAFENIKFVSATTTQITLAGQNGGANILLFVIAPPG